MQCEFVKLDGNKCKSHAMVGDTFCFTHCPQNRTEHIEAATKGGKATQNKDFVQLDPMPVEDADGAIYLLEDTINRIRIARADGTMDLKTANSIGFLTGKLLECRKNALFEESILKTMICKDKKIDTMTFRQMMKEYNDDAMSYARNALEGIEERYKAFKKKNGGTFYS